MKEIISGNDLRKLILKSTNLMCDCVSSTLGPSGNNVLINKDDLSPFITNDGVTIAESISSDDLKVNTVLEILKEASLKTNELVGDGTTTTLVLLQSILNESYNEIDKGKNPIVLKKELVASVNKVLKLLKKEKIKPTKEDLISIASVSANDQEIGALVYKVFNKMKSKYAIKLDMSNSDTYYEIKKGYNIETEVPTIYFDNNKNIILNNTYILLLKGFLSSLEDISEILNEAIEQNKNIVILCEEFDENILNQIILFKLENNKNIYLFKIPDYGSKKENLLSDIEFLTRSKIKNINFESVSFTDLGLLSCFIIKKDEIVLISEINAKEKVKDLKKYLYKLSDYEKELLETRISKLENGICTIYVGGPTKTEIKEKLMRFEDAINAVNIAKDGVLYGEGITLLKISNMLDNKDIILKNALCAPFNKILKNAGVDDKNIKDDIISSNYKKIYNIKENKLEDINKYKILDPYKVIETALTNAVSIASMLFTINYLVVNEAQKQERLEI